MNKRIFQAALFAFVTILMIAPQAMALEIYVDDYGSVKFYQGEVLGKDDDREEKEQEDSGDEHEVENKDAEKETEDQNEQEDLRDRERERTEIRKSTPIKTLYSSAKKQIELKTEDDGRYKVEIQDGDNKLKIERRSIQPSQFENKDEIEAETINLSYPASSKSNLSAEERDEYFKNSFSSRLEIKNLNEGDKLSKIEEKKVDFREYSNKIQAEKQERSEERIEIRDLSDSEQENKFEIQSRDTKAKLNGANFSYDQETGEILLVTPSGQEHILQHLPDQAVQRMIENGFFLNNETEVEIETADDGSVKYKAPGKKNKRFLGLFDREVETEVVLDDLTGETTQTEVETSGLSSFLNFFSF
ncbi:MAG: hypothetical protein GW942_01415 [Candidatus Pacebacteria bacterium]|nr:hypothetical protein [Candidatus Paceibacterota bacterium]